MGIQHIGLELDKYLGLTYYILYDYWVFGFIGIFMWNSISVFGHTSFNFDDNLAIMFILFDHVLDIERALFRMEKIAIYKGLESIIIPIS